MSTDTSGFPVPGLFEQLALESYIRDEVSAIVAQGTAIKYQPSPGAPQPGFLTLTATTGAQIMMAWGNPTVACVAGNKTSAFTPVAHQLPRTPFYVGGMLGYGGFLYHLNLQEYQIADALNIYYYIAFSPAVITTFNLDYYWLAMA